MVVDKPLKKMILINPSDENGIVFFLDGVIKSIAVTKGDAVDKGQLLIELNKG
jgi:multidrug efflux pump subunit AcrA (membrane-fusion protein)